MSTPLSPGCPHGAERKLNGIFRSPSVGGGSHGTRSGIKARSRSVQIGLAHRSIQIPHPCLTQNIGVEQPCIDAHSVISWIPGRPVRYAAATTTAMEVDCRLERHLTRRIVRPEYAIASADLTIVLSDRHECLGDLQPHSAAAARCLHPAHDSERRPNIRASVSASGERLWV